MKHSTTRTPRAGKARSERRRRRAGPCARRAALKAAVLSQLAQARLDGAFLGACARGMFKEYTP